MVMTWPCIFVSIPNGSIKSIFCKFRFMGHDMFQFLMVRLKVENAKNLQNELACFNS